MKLLIDCECCEEVFAWIHGEDRPEARVALHRILTERGWYQFASGGYVCPKCGNDMMEEYELKQWRFI